MVQLGRKCLMAVLLSGVALTAMPAVAASANSREVDELVVTAQKREESLKDVPIAMTAISSVEVKKAGLTSFMDLEQYTPTMVINNNGDSRVATVSIRGVGSSQDQGKQSSIGIFVDGVFMSRIGMGISDLLDIERVEVLRGPQGTLFGMNTAAGLISIITASPNIDEFHGYAEGVVGNYNRVEVRGSVTGPIIPGKLGFSLAGYSVDRSGIVYNATLKRDVDDQKKTGMRAKLRYVGENFNYTLTGDVQRENDECCAYLFIALKPGANILGIPVAPLAPPGFPYSRTTVTNRVNTNQNRGGGVSGEGNWTIAGGNVITSVTAARNWTISADSDTDALPLDIIDGLFVHQHHKQFSQELRITSPTGQKLEYVGGLYYFTHDAVDQQYVGIAGLGKPGTDGRSNIASDHEDTSKAVFANLTYHLTPQATLAAGARYTQEHQTVDFTQLSNSFAFANLGSIHSTRDDSATTYTLTAKYDWTPDVMTYATYARGFKPGGFDLTRLPNFTHLQFAAETNNNMEIGVKAYLMDRRVTLTGAAFHTDYNNFQTLAFDGFNLVTTNAKRFITQGFEAEIIARPLEGLRVQAAYAYTDATYKDFKNGQCPAGAATPICDLSGRPLAEAPRNSFNSSVEYRHPLGGSSWAGYVRGEYSYKSSMYLSQALDPFLFQKAFSIVNARIGVESADGLKLELWARNLFDKDYLQLGFNAPVITGGYAGFLNEPRMVGGRISKSF
ncbi:TonB-dependent receptor [Phenylobacterium sp.]|uniref:TonB-dependent receptor n=1 Tax=Phenylobacterium sp. TaxID=1871053 RepID=UPI0035627835